MLMASFMIGGALLASLAMVSPQSDAARGEIIALVEASYINGAFNELDTETMRRGFHPVFEIHSANGTELGRYPINEWVGDIEKRKSQPDFDPADQKWEHKFPIIDITGDAAIVKVELTKDSKHIYTDYLSLLKFTSGWQIVGKVYHQHSH